MNTYISPKTIRMLRERRGITQRALAERIGVTDKAVSKWETGRGLPDVSLVESLAGALGVSVAELFSGEVRVHMPASGGGWLYVCCNKHGLFRVRTPRVVSKKLV